ncbi:hypothetical protein [Citreimonas sp.]|uniref:hypothetical protein n=1 Tax=Citreimonas sp. TaxID=3036715 RepID=UPI004059538B
MSHQTEAEQLRMVLADIVLGAVLHPWDDRYEVVPRRNLDKARMMIDHDDVAAAAARARADGATP